ncbi:hypothetical protein [Luteimonas sp. MC1828]|uniref:hypothetical protein n=1 Tax=Luteimonas sp. MC1828 TaxID=2799787 RepID=UPI0018F26C2E|nr:hypothetical protein [Luteimonas sp. MC1828]MBJ7574970.1 hypothetical protein [Luteimonas sp. MC1828]
MIEPAAPQSRPSPDLSDARWFPVDLHVPERSFGFLPLDVACLEDAVFLDSRIPAPLGEAIAVRADTLPRPAVAPALAWLFHTSFCCSTLLARALHVPPHSTSLKEPLVLRRLADARHAGWPLDGLLEASVALLSRPWFPGAAVVVKPTHAALNVAEDLMASAPASRGIVLTSSLEDFVVSNLKKTTETRLKIPELAERALRAGGLASRLPAAALQPPDLSAAATLQWAAQRDLCTRVLDTRGEQLRVLDASAFLADVAGVALRCNAWLRLGIPPDLLAGRVERVVSQNAKAVAHGYGPDRRRRDAAALRQAHEREVGQALDWFQRFVRPALADEAWALEAHHRAI